MKKKKICVYTCITGDYDSLREINDDVYEKEISYYCFTNNKNIKSDTWEVIYISDPKLSNHMLSRKIKILGHEIIDKYDTTVYIDGNVTLKKKITEFIRKETNIDKYDMASFKHRFRDCIYDEAIECVKMKKDDKKQIQKQVEFLEKDNYPKHNGLYENTIMIRNNKPEIKKAMALWYETLTKYSKRDQLSLNWVLYKTNINVYPINMNVFLNDYFETINHNKNNKITSYRAYFGKDDSYENFDYELDIQGDYELKKDRYIANIKIPKDTDYIKFEITDVIGVFFDNIEIKAKGLKEYKVNNYLEVKGKKYFYHVIPIIEIIGDFKKNNKITISLEMKKINEYDYNILILDYNDEYQKSLIKQNEILLKNNDIQNELNNSKNINNSLTEQIDNLKKENKNLENKKEVLENEINSLNNKNNILSDENKELKIIQEKQQQTINNLETEIKKIVNSKGWKLLEKLRKVKNKI